ncbi:MAG: hypothetical protein OXI55_08675 [Gammaproteobacteria bacterium]|nr:hypothetical protein [Gammaproteobacteria bacterium]
MKALRVAWQAFRASWIVVALCFGLAMSTAGLAWRTIELGAQVAKVSAAAAASAAQQRARHRKEIAKTKARARLRRMAVAIPLVGSGLLIHFERRDYLEWKEENPEKGPDVYATEVLEASAEVSDDVLQLLPEGFRPQQGALLEWLQGELAGLDDQAGGGPTSGT